MAGDHETRQNDRDEREMRISIQARCGVRDRNTPCSRSWSNRRSLMFLPYERKLAANWLATLIGIEYSSIFITAVSGGVNLGLTAFSNIVQGENFQVFSATNFYSFYYSSSSIKSLLTSKQCTLKKYEPFLNTYINPEGTHWNYYRIYNIWGTHWIYNISLPSTQLESSRD